MDVRLCCSAVLFDLDGVLVDSRAVVERQWRRWAADHAFDPDDIVSFAYGKRTTDTIAALAPELDVEREARLLEQREIADRMGLKVFPGAAELLRSIPANRRALPPREREISQCLDQPPPGCRFPSR